MVKAEFTQETSRLPFLPRSRHSIRCALILRVFSKTLALSDPVYKTQPIILMLSFYGKNILLADVHSWIRCIPLEPTTPECSNTGSTLYASRASVNGRCVQGRWLAVPTDFAHRDTTRSASGVNAAVHHGMEFRGVSSFTNTMK